MCLNDLDYNCLNNIDIIGGMIDSWYQFKIHRNDLRGGVICILQKQKKA